MADICSGQRVRKTSSRGCPCHISLPSFPTNSSPQVSGNTEKVRIQAKTTSPRPPTPPRRHTLVEICRYADEQCAYIEHMTRELEAEEAARRQSMPTTPLGAITNPFNGPADMWWRPTSAKEMYGTSALRRQQEKQEHNVSKPCLATDDLLDTVVIKHSELNNYEDKADSDIADDASDVFSPEHHPLESYATYVTEYEALLREPHSELLKTLELMHISHRTLHGPWSDSTPTINIGQTTQHTLNLESTNIGGCNVFMVFPKIILCLFVLPLVLVVGYFGDGLHEDEGDEEDW